MSKLRIAARVLLGLAFVFFGLNGFFHFFSPPLPQGAAGEFMAGLVASGFVMPAMSLVEVIAGVMLLTGMFVPLALTLLAPILINILGYHLMLDMPGIGAGAVLTVLEIFLAWSYRSAFRPLFTTNAAALDARA
jgi:putative oxidoreductase